MNHHRLDWLVPACYAGLVILAMVFAPVAVAGTAIIGAILTTGYFLTIRRRLPSWEGGRPEADGELPEPDDPRRLP